MSNQRKKTSHHSVKRLADLKARLARANREEDVKAAWAKALALDYDTSEDIDLYTPQVLSEFKHVAGLTQTARCAQVLAQVMYYLRRLRLGYDRRAVPKMLALIDRDTVVLSAVGDWRDIFGDSEGRFDWEAKLPASLGARRAAGDDAPRGAQ
jgi:hypothetical protein